MQQGKARIKNKNRRRRTQRRGGRGWRQRELAQRRECASRRESTRRVDVEKRIMALLPLNDGRRGELRKLAVSAGVPAQSLPVKKDDPGGERLCRLIAEAELS